MLEYEDIIQGADIQQGKRSGSSMDDLKDFDLNTLKDFI